MRGKSHESDDASTTAAVAAMPKRIKLDAAAANAANSLAEATSNDINPSSSLKSIRTILSVEMTADIPTELMFVCKIHKKKSISIIMQELNAHLPLPQYQHLKRIDGQQRILIASLRDVKDCLGQNDSSLFCQHLKIEFGNRWTNDHLSHCKQIVTDQSSSDADSFDCILRAFLLCNGCAVDIINLLVPHSSVDDNNRSSSSSTINLTEVASEMPLLRWQFDVVNRLWPCKFHQNKLLEAKFNNCVFNETDTQFHLLTMKLIQFVREKFNGTACGVAIDPRNRHIIAIGIVRPGGGGGGGERETHPIMHCAMLLIDGVARSQNGGAWNRWLIDDEDDDVVDVSSSLIFSGVTAEIRAAIEESFPTFKFGAQKPMSREQINSIEWDVEQQNGDNLRKYGPYLCTGYDVYLLQEPCVMCAMALVHSRVRSVFFNRAEPKGALKTLTNLHAVKALNHHYDVYQVL